MGKPRRKVRQRSIEWFERDVPGIHMDRGGVLQGCSGPLSRFPPLQRANLVPGALFPGFGCGREILFNYIFFVLFFCLLFHRLAIKISLPCHIFLQVYLYWSRSAIERSGTTHWFVAVDLLIFYILFKDFHRIQGLFKTTSKIQDLFKSARTMDSIPHALAG